MASTSSTMSGLPRPRDLAGHRSFTLPARLNDAKPTSPSLRLPDAEIETLFESPKCKIVSFSPAIPSTRLKTVSLDAADPSSQPVGELPCGSSTEHTIALGALLVYRVPGSVAFLNSGKLVHAVLPKSACWCVDGKTKFVLGVPGKKYYRIELPCENEHDQAQADEFKVVLANISQYETTVCPFKRGFHVELPEMNSAKTKRPWQPKHAPGVISPWSPEGQHLADGVQPERLFPSPSYTQDRSPRRQYVSKRGDVDSSGSESALESGSEIASDPEQPGHRVPQLVATYDELAPSPGLDTLPTISQPTVAVKQDGCQKPSVESCEESLFHEEEEVALKTMSDHPSAILQAKASTSIEDPSETVPELDHKVPRHGSESSRSKSKSYIEVEADCDNLQLDNGEITPPESPSLDLGPFSAQQIDASNPLGILTTPRLQTKNRIEGAEWLGIGDNEDTPTTTKPLSDLQTLKAPAFASLSPGSASEADFTGVQRLRHNSAHSLASVESSASFHSFHSPTSPILHSPIFEAESLTSMATKTDRSSESPNMHKREISSNTITDKDIHSAEDDLSTPTWPRFTAPGDMSVTDEDPGAETESDAKSYITATSPISPRSPSLGPQERQPRNNSPSSSLRIRLRRRRTHSPMPAAANIYIPPSSLSGHLTNAILHKTANLLLGPPVQLVALMLNLARRFADGKLTGETYTYGNRGQPIPCEWCDSDFDYDGNSSEEDDYGISLGGTPEKRKRRGNGPRARLNKDAQWALD